MAALLGARPGGVIRPRSSLLRQAVGWWDTRYYSGSGSLPNLGWGGSALHLTLPGGANDPLWLPYAGTPYASLSGSAGNYLSAPDSPALSIPGDIDLRADVALTDWTPSAIGAVLGKWTDTGDQRSYWLGVNTTGTFRLGTSPDGAAGTILTHTSTVAPSVTDGARLQIRATLDVDDGAGNRVAKFYTRASGLGLTLTDNTNWTQLGTTVTTAGTTSIFDSTAVMELGSLQGGASQNLTGNLFAAAVLDGINGTVVFDWRASQATEPYATSTEASANAATVTYNRSATGRKLAVVDRPMFLFGTDDYLTIADNATLDFAAGESLTAVVVCRVYGTTASQVLLAKKTDLTTAAGYALDRGTANAAQFTIADGTASAADVVASAVSQGVATLIAGVRDVTADTVTAYKNGTASGSPTADGTTATLANASAFDIGANSTPGGYADMEFMGAGIFRRALSAAEIARLATEFGVAA